MGFSWIVASSFCWYPVLWTFNLFLIIAFFNWDVFKVKAFFLLLDCCRVILCAFFSFLYKQVFSTTSCLLVSYKLNRFWHSPFGQCHCSCVFVSGLLRPLWWYVELMKDVSEKCNEHNLLDWIDIESLSRMPQKCNHSCNLGSSLGNWCNDVCANFVSLHIMHCFTIF